MLSLRAETLVACAERLPTPGYDRTRLSTGVVHVGVGGFHRAHQAMYHDRLMNQGQGPDWADPRTTPVGAFLRRTHLDELPQLFNVLRGDMSIVGPRPERPEFIAMLEQNIPFWSRRLLIKPGITGWAQVHCGYASDHAGANEKLAYDFWYLRHRTLAVDIAVCLQTLWIVLEILAPERIALRRWRTARQQVAP
jgi:lipopolysaccharide/colanic/teichoic acid biosynthesis glycosyltransferase